MPTVGEILNHVVEARQKVAVLRALASYLSFQFITRDSTTAKQVLKTDDGMIIPEEVIQQIASELQVSANTLESRAATVLGTGLPHILPGLPGPDGASAVDILADVI